MKKILLLAATLCFTLAVDAQRDTLNLDFGWQFKLVRSDVQPAQINFHSSDVQDVDLPHDFQISQPWMKPAPGERADFSDQAANVKSRLSARAFKEMGSGAYRRVLHVPAEWKGRRLVLDFGGIMLVGDVYLNGERIGGTDYGYVGFGIDITDKVRYGSDNEIIVIANTMGPNNSRWYTGGGLYRDVHLLLTDSQLYFARHPLFITTKDNRLVNITAEICHYSRQKSGRVQVRILDATGQAVAQKDSMMVFSPRRHDKEYVLTPVPLPDPQLWSCDHPYLYTAEVSVYKADGTLADQVTESFGVRTFEFSPQFGLKLNGRKLLLKGIANHSTFGPLGAAVYPRAIEKTIKTLKAFGFNHIRTSHNPYSEDFYRLCDKYGIVVLDELYDKWLKQYAGGRTDWTNLWQYDVPEWVKRDRSHACVAFWSLGNELQTYPDLPFNDWGVTAYRLQHTLLYRYDATRPVTVAMHPRGRNWQTDSLPCDLAMITDIQAYNYRYMYFPGDRRRFPDMIFYQSEANLSNMGPNFYGMNLNKVIGLAYWGMIDYLGESHGWPAKGSDRGVFDMSLQPKPEAYLLKSMFSDQPVVHIGIVDEEEKGKVWNGVKESVQQLSDQWNRTPGKRYTVYTYTNAPEVELLVNGKSLGVKKNTLDPDHRDKIRWDNVEYQPGYIEAVARKDGRVIARHRIDTYGKAVRLELRPDQEVWHADGMDLQFVRVNAVDAKGNRVWSADGEVRFSVEGNARIIGVCNGDINTDENLAGSQVRLHHGTAQVILRAGRTPGRVLLGVAVAGLKKENLKLATR